MKRFLLCLPLAALVLAQRDATRFGPDSAFHLEYSQDDAGLRSHAVMERIEEGGIRVYPLPQSTLADYARFRPADLKRNPIANTPKGYVSEEAIGPHQVEGDKLWFGKAFYDAEGLRGVGAFGFFDTLTREYRMLSPPEIAPYEVSAMLVEPDNIWMGLDHFGEDVAKTPGGLVQWVRATQALRRFQIEFVATKIERQGDAVRLTTGDGYALLKNGVVRRFEVRQDAGGKVETVPVDRFPPPPTHQ